MQKSWSKPALVKFGSVEDITAQGTGPCPDGSLKVGGQNDAIPGQTVANVLSCPA